MGTLFDRVCRVATLAVLPWIAAGANPPKELYFDISTGDGYVFDDVGKDGGTMAILPSGVGVIPAAQLIGDELWLTFRSEHDGEIVQVLVLKPGTMKPDDWDLVGQGAGDHTPEALAEPIRGYLHPLEDGYAAYFDSREAFYREPSELSPKQKSQVAYFTAAASEKLLWRAPDDEVRVLIMLDSYLRAGKDWDFVCLLSRWEDLLDNATDPIRQRVLASCRQIAQSHELTWRGENGFDVMVEFANPANDLTKRMSALPRFLRYRECVIRRDGLFGAPASPGVFDLYMAIKVATVEAQFALLRGERNRARRIAAACHAMASCLQQGADSVGFQVGAAWRGIAADSLLLQVLNACESDEELKAMFDQADELGRDAFKVTPQELATRFAGELGGATNPISREQLATQHVVSNTKLTLVKAVAAARYVRLTTGSWPHSPEDFQPLMTNGPGRDWFADSDLHFASTHNDGFTIWSVGPDGDDDEGKVGYTAATGEISDGDVIVEIPAERTYPFPTKPFQPKSVEDVSHQFPNGLPPDSFANTRGKGLSVHSGNPVTIFSFGPDVDEQEYRANQPFTQPQYDPTNGTTSVGNLYYQADRRAVMRKEEQ